MKKLALQVICLCLCIASLSSCVAKRKYLAQRKRADMNQSQIDMLNGRVKNLNDSIAMLSGNINDMNGRISQLGLENQSANNQLNMTKEQIAAQRARLRQMQNLLDQQQKATEALRSKIADALTWLQCKRTDSNHEKRQGIYIYAGKVCCSHRAVQ